jgi:hypothetical protein
MPASDCIKPGYEKKQIEKLYGKNYIIRNGYSLKLGTNKPVTIRFDDGSQITYTLTETNTGINQVSAPLSPMSSLSALSSTRKALGAHARYAHLADICTISLYADCTWSGRTVTINRLYSGSSIFAGSVTRNTQILERVGQNNKSACGRLSGQINCSSGGSERSYDYAFREYIDPANSTSALLAVEY